MTKHLRVSIAAAKVAGTFLRKSFLTQDQQSFRLKGRQNLVTPQDRKVENLIAHRLRKAFPSYGIRGEERGQQRKTSAAYQWVIDPIDGTSNFIARVPMFCVVISLIRERQDPVAGVIYHPITDELFVAEEGGGAFRNGKRIRVSKVRQLRKAYTSLCYGHTDAPPFQYKKQMKKYDWLKQHALKVRVVGSGSLSLAYVAAGRFEASVNFPVQKAWDMAAGALLVTEAGGEISTLLGNPWKPTGTNILATNGHVHPAMTKMLRHR